MSIKLTRSGPNLKPGQKCQHNWVLSVSAESTEEGLSDKIFVYHATPENDPLQGDTFSNVASLQDMDLIPEDAPMSVPGEDDVYANVPYYRTNTVTFNCYNVEQAADIWNIIKIDTAALVREYKASQNLKAVERVDLSNTECIDITG